MRFRLLFFLAVVLAAAIAVPVSVAGSKATYYVSLGDSLAQGYQPIGGPHSPESPPGYNQGYADQLFKLTRARYTQLREVKLGCGGETTETMRFGGICSYDHTSQLAEAVAFLQAHAGEIAYVTIDIGANDVLSGGGIGAVFANLPPIVAALSAAASGVPILAMNYYDPFVAPVWFQTHSLVALQAQVDSTVAYNSFLEGLYQMFGVGIADVESAFSVTDLSLVNGTPVNVLRACAWTWACAKPPFGFDIHANNDGYGVIAEAFLEALDT
jgi:lysophospholipase L1-like esterase